MRMMLVNKIAKFILVIIISVSSIFVLDAVIFDLSEGLIKMVRHVLPLRGFTAIICMYLIS